MIFGIGTDIVDVLRIGERTENQAFINMVFTPTEIEYCNQSNRNAERFAGRFAAKEAFFKALGTGISGDLTFLQVEVENNLDGKPFLNISGAALQKINEAEIEHIHLSISHEKLYATAVVILER